MSPGSRPIQPKRPPREGPKVSRRPRTTRITPSRRMNLPRGSIGVIGRLRSITPLCGSQQLLTRSAAKFEVLDYVVVLKYLRKFMPQCLGVLQVLRIEALAEPVVYGGKDVASVRGLTVLQ